MAYGFGKSSQQFRLVPGPRSRPGDRYIVPLRCCILLLYQARELWDQDFEFIGLNWVELRDSNP